MPKIKERLTNKVNRYVSEHKEIFKTDGSILFCKTCNKSISFATKFQVDQHLQSAKHKELFDRSNAKLTQNFLTSTTNKCNQFFTDLCDTFIAADIPLEKLNNAEVKEFFKKYTNEIIPNESTLRKNYITVLFDSLMSDIKAKLQNHFLWVSIDETTDIQGRFVANIIVGIMHVDEEISNQRFLLNVVELDKTNHGTIARAFDDSIKLLGENFNKSKILLYLTDAAPYMVKSGSGLQLFYNKMLHVTCVVHSLHRVAETIRHLFKDVDELIANGKKVFLKAPSRNDRFKEMFPDLCLPPEPIVTRWGSWLAAVEYYANNFDNFSTIVNTFDDADALSIKKTKDLLIKSTIKPHLAFISANYGFLSETIKKLEGKMSLKQQLNLLDHAKTKICAVEGEYGEIIKNKLNSVLEKNIGIKKIQEISNIIDCGQTRSSLKDYSPTELRAFKNAPLSSVDVERSFSLYKNFLRCNRTNFLFENLIKQFVIYANKAISKNFSNIF